MQVYEMYPLPGENKFNGLEFCIYFYSQDTRFEVSVMCIVQNIE